MRGSEGEIHQMNKYFDCGPGRRRRAADDGGFETPSLAQRRPSRHGDEACAFGRHYTGYSFRLGSGHSNIGERGFEGSLLAGLPALQQPDRVRLARSDRGHAEFAEDSGHLGREPFEEPEQS